MKIIFSILCFTIISFIAIYHSINKKIDNKLCIILLSFAIISGLSISNYDIVNKLKFGQFELETAKREINQTKINAIDSINAEVNSQKETIKLLIQNANYLSDKFDSQKNELMKLINTATILQDNIKTQKQDIVNLNNEGKRTKVDIEILNNASAQIALILIRTTYFMLETKSEFGSGPRLTKAIDEINKDLNKIIPMVIPNPQQRQKWIQELQNTLPKQ
jgi:hypothetical protein